MSDDEINQRFMPSQSNPIQKKKPRLMFTDCLPVDLSQYSPSRLPLLQRMQEFFNNDHPSGQESNAAGTESPSVNKSAPEKRKRRSGKAHKIETTSTPNMLSSTVHEEMEPLNIQQPFTVCTTEEDWTFYDPLGRSRQVHPSFHVSPLFFVVFVLYILIL